MSYPAYSEYKDSGIEWLGKIPSHWGIKRLSHFVEERRETVSDKDYEPLSVTMQGIVPQLETAAKSDATDNRKLVKKNDFVINSRSDRKGSAGVSELDGSVSQISIVLNLKSITPEYTHHLLRSYPFQEEFYRFGKGIHADLWSTKYSEMKNILIPEVPEAEQLAIASYIEYETIKIDTLINKSERLISLLQEKRQAMISYAVTKGLDPDAPMKDSGIEWLGSIPGSWKASRIGWLFDVRRGSGYQNIDMEIEGKECVSMIRISDMHSIEPVKIVKNKEVMRYTVQTEDILVAGTGATAGISMIVKETENGLVHSYNSIKLRLKNKKVKSQFILYFLRSDFIKTLLDLSFSGSAQPFVDTQGLKDLNILVPDINTQKKIVDCLHEGTTKIDNLINKAEQQIEKLKEHRSALISAAVTGKVDVREWNKKEKAA